MRDDPPGRAAERRDNRYAITEDGDDDAVAECLGLLTSYSPRDTRRPSDGS